MRSAAGKGLVKSQPGLATGSITAFTFFSSEVNRVPISYWLNGQRFNNDGA